MFDVPKLRAIFLFFFSLFAEYLSLLSHFASLSAEIYVFRLTHPHTLAIESMKTRFIP